MGLTPERRAALDALARIRVSDAYAPEVLESVSRARDLHPRQRAFAKWLVWGTLQYQGSLDHAIDRFAKAPGRIPPRVRDALRAGVYEILFGETPPPVVIDQTVEAAKDAAPGLAGMANAIMRRVLSEADSFPWLDEETHPTHAQALRLGHPPWMADMLLSDLGPRTAAAVMDADNRPAPVYLRHNPFRGTFEELLDVLQADGAGPAACELPGCIWVEQPEAAIAGRALREGMAIVMDAAAQFAAHALGDIAGKRVVDVGAGRGGKTLAVQAIAAAQGRPADVTAVDLHASKLEVLEARVSDLGVPSIRTVAMDATDLPSPDAGLGRGCADLVLVDAPCSGLGTLRRHPEKRWRILPEDIQRLTDLQTRLLFAASRLVSPGGAIVYSTCTITRAENQEVVLSFLGSEAGRAFAADDLSALTPPAWRGWCGDEGWFQSLPSVGGPDGHFVARLVRRED
ncbi:MAG: 16S rRNA (cytosine(967)-C(5))-methyltransferase RsmB [Coriobacteriia bacterium]